MAALVQPSSGYRLEYVDLGKTIKVRVTFTDEGGSGETLTSDVTTAVAADATGPTLTEATVEVDGNRISLIFDELLDTAAAATSPPTSAFAVTADGAPVAVGTVLVPDLTKAPCSWSI